MLIWSNDPYNSAWEHLNLFQSKDAVSRLLNGDFQSKREILYCDHDAIEKKSVQISYSIKQAYEYFKSAEAVTINTSPLLYFYGMLSLSKAVILANNPTIFLNDLKYHGLFARPITEDLKNYQENEADWSIEKEFAVTNNGVFQDIVKIVNGAGDIVEIVNGTGFGKNTIFYFKNLLSVDPEIRDIYQRNYSEEPKSISLYSNKLLSKDPYIYEICPLTLDREKFESDFPIFKTQFDFQEIYHSQSLRYTSNASFINPPTAFRIYTSLHSRPYLVSGLEYEYSGSILSKYVSPALNDYIGMFILGTCVRYKQDLWGRVINGEAGGSLGVINFFISTSKIRFPTFVLSQLLNEQVEYGTTGRW